MKEQADRTEYSAAYITWSSGSTTQATTAINARLPSLLRARISQSILYVPDLDNIAGTHERNRLLTSDPHFCGALHQPWGHAQVWDELH